MSVSLEQQGRGWSCEEGGLQGRPSKSWKRSPVLNVDDLEHILEEMEQDHSTQPERVK